MSPADRAKEGGSGVRQRTLVDPAEIQHIESECPSCHRVTAVSVDMTAKIDPADSNVFGRGQEKVLERCLWCKTKMSNSGVLSAMLEALKHAERAIANSEGKGDARSFTFRFALRDKERDL